MKEYTLKIVEDNQGTMTIHRENSGFSVFELLGVYTHIHASLLQQSYSIVDDSVNSTLIATTSTGKHEIHE